MDLDVGNVEDEEELKNTDELAELMKSLDREELEDEEELLEEAKDKLGIGMEVESESIGYEGEMEEQGLTVKYGQEEEDQEAAAGEGRGEEEEFEEVDKEKTISEEEETEMKYLSDEKEESSKEGVKDEDKKTSENKQSVSNQLNKSLRKQDQNSETVSGELSVESQEQTSEDQKDKSEDVSNMGVKSEVFNKELTLNFYLTDDIERVICFLMESDKLVKEALDQLADYINKDAEDIKLYYAGTKMVKKQQLYKYLLCNEDTMCINVVFEFDDSSETSESSKESYDPDMKVIKVQIKKSDGTTKYLEILIHNIAFTKEWCGGYRNKKTGIIYHNAWSQTNLKERGRGLLPGEKPPDLFTRTTQTHLPYVETGINTPYDRSTQMWRSDHYMPAFTDKVITVKPYKSHEQLTKNMTPLNAVLILQRFFRLCLTKKKFRATLHAVQEQNKAALQFKGILSQEIHQDRMNHLIKETFPLNRGDFYDLYTILGIWKENEQQKIYQSKDGVARKAAIYELFEKEVECLYNIETQRIRSKNENLKKIDIKCLENSARYTVKRYTKGNITITDTLDTQRAREFKEIYSSYQRTDVKPEIRIDVLTTFKQMLSKLEHIDVTKDIIELLDRECDLIYVNIPESKLEGLRKRVESLFFNLIKSPEFNREIVRMRKPIESRMKQPLYRCKGCRKIKSPAFFFSHLRLPSFRFCTSCSWMNTTANATINLAPYTRLLNTLRASEIKKCCRSAVVFLLQPMGMYYIMNVIWQGQSCISGSTYLPELRMTRWDKREEWAPWNTILMTETEAIAHDALPDPEKFYTRWFILKVKNKHILARMHFSKVYYTDLELRESGKWVKAKDEGFYTSRRHVENLGNKFSNYFFEPVCDARYDQSEHDEIEKVDVGV